MTNKVKDIDIDMKNRTCYFFNKFINIKIFDLNNIKTNKKSSKNLLIYYNGYVTIKHSKYVKMYSVNPFYIIFRNVNGYFEEINNSMNLTVVATKAKKKLKNMKNCGLKSEL